VRWSVGLSVLLTVLLITVLSVRMAAGADPALGPKIVRKSIVRESATAPLVQQVPATPPAAVPLAPVQTTTS
jgi:hypothetical protein